MSRRIAAENRRRTDRRVAPDASKLNFTTNSVAQIVIWVLSLAAAWYGVQSKLGEIQSDVRVIATRMDGDSKLSEKDATARDARIRELEVTYKAFEIRIRNLETENARRGVK